MHKAAKHKIQLTQYPVNHPNKSGIGHVWYLSRSIHTILVPKSMCLVQRTDFSTCHIRYMGKSSSVQYWSFLVPRLVRYQCDLCFRWRV